MNLESNFQQEMLQIYDEAKQFDYYPNYFLRMVVDSGWSLGSQILARRQ